MDVRVLEYFLRVVELGSINRAARELNLSQPSLSRWLAMLERETGTPLLIRTRRGVQPTDVGRQLAERAQPILRQLNLLRDEIGARAMTNVALAMPYSLRMPVTAPFIERHARDAPNVALSLHEGMSHSLRTLMEEGLVDIGVMASSERVPESYDSAPLLTEALFLVGPAGAGLSPGRPVTGARLAEVPLVLPSRPNVIRIQVEEAIRLSGQRYRGSFDANSLALCLELTRRGLGHTVMPASALEASDASDGLEAAPVADLEITWSICTNRARHHSVAVRGVAAALSDFVDGLSSR